MRRSRATRPSGRRAGGPAPASGPPTRRDRRHARGRAKHRPVEGSRRGRLLLVVAVVLSLAVLAAWFPAGALLSQHKALASASAQLQQLRQQDQQLRQEQALLSQPREIARIARQQYELVTPGQRAYQVLPPSGATNASGTPSADPGLAPLVSPNASTELSLGDPPVNAVPPSPAAAGTPAAGGTSPATSPAPAGGSTSTTTTPGANPGAGSVTSSAAAAAAVARGRHAAAPPAQRGMWDRIVASLEFWH